MGGWDGGENELDRGREVEEMLCLAVCVFVWSVVVWSVLLVFGYMQHM